MIHLRDADARDLDALHALDQVCYPPGIAYSKMEMRYYLRRTGAVSLIAEDDLADDTPNATVKDTPDGARDISQTAQTSGLIGFVIAEPFRYGKATAGHIITIDVAPAARRQGIGTILMDALEDRLVSAGVDTLRLEVAVDNVAAQHFYTGRGFILKETIRNYYLGTLDARVMEKSLSKDH